MTVPTFLKTRQSGFVLFAGLLMLACEFRNNPERGSYEVQEVVGCMGVRVGGNVIVPYGLEVVDCDGAMQVTSAFVRQCKYVSVETGRCSLRGIGQDAYFRCWREEGVDIPESFGADGVPRRDSDGNIRAIVFHSMMNADSLPGRLLGAGVVELTPECESKARDIDHFCNRYLLSRGAAAGEAN